jgi:hypothetical protein
MLTIKSPRKAGDTITLKTGAGEEVVARFVEEDTDTITVKRPMTLIPSQQGIGLGPFAFTLSMEDNIVLNKNVILMIAMTEQEMAAQYTQSTTNIAI